MSLKTFAILFQQTAQPPTKQIFEKHEKQEPEPA